MIAKKIVFIIVLFVLTIGAGGVYVGQKMMRAGEESAGESQVQEADGGEMQGEETQSEQEQMLEAARNYIKQYSVEGMEVEFEIIRQLEKWALLEATPITIETDKVVVMEKVEGEWICRDFGTILPGWKERVPELFE